MNKKQLIRVAVFGIILCLWDVPAMAQYETYVNRYKTIAMREMNDYGIPASITLAQGILESAAGTSRLSLEANNHFGIKCHNDWQGETIYHDDDQLHECFRKYDLPEESFIDHSLFLKNRARYSFLFELDKTDYRAWAKGLKQAGYATDPNYAKRLIHIIESNNLQRFDTLSFVSNHPQVSTPIKQKATKNPAGVKFVEVQPGESYYTIAKAHHIPFSSVCRYNDVDRKSRQPITGDVVYLRPKKRSIKTGKGTHKVQVGESMHSISQQYGIRLHSLYDLNNMPYDKAAELGQILKLRK